MHFQLKEIKIEKKKKRNKGKSRQIKVKIAARNASPSVAVISK